MKAHLLDIYSDHRIQT